MVPLWTSEAPSFFSSLYTFANLYQYPEMKEIEVSDLLRCQDFEEI